MNRKAAQAWDLYTRMETSAESLGISLPALIYFVAINLDLKNLCLKISEFLIGILHLLGNDCYRTGQFLVAAKAFDVLDKYDPNPEHAAAKRGACVGLFQMILAGREHK